MPEHGKHEKTPRRSSIEALIKYLKSNDIVKDVRYDGSHIIEIERVDRESLSAFMTNIYIVSEADVYEILSGHSGIDAIVTMSAWDGYTSAAKKMCRAKNIGLFKFKEFLGAVYYEGKKFLDYVPPDERDKIWSLTTRD